MGGIHENIIVNTYYEKGTVSEIGAVVRSTFLANPTDQKLFLMCEAHVSWACFLP